ncbi:MAG: ABC transporter six-transmembrane domain-containing protein [Ignavibacteriales bacterium]|nr:ABC transporter six-transmembrane domain-containing protein [Ignavibacteriales bacterium]
MKLTALLTRFKKGISLAIGLVIIEHVAWIVEPAVFGKVIDALIERASGQASNLQTSLFPLFLWIGVFSINSGTGVIRRIVDQKIYLAMFTQLATDISTVAQEKKFRASKTAALAQLSEQYITFFQYRVPEIIEQVVQIGGTVIALAVFDWRISLTCLTIVFPLLLINKIYTRKVSALQKDSHDTFENAYDVFSTQKPEEIRSYYTKSASIKQKIANWGALNFGVMRCILLFIFLAVLYISIDLDDFTTGSIYSIVAYIWTFVTSSEYLPELMESWTSLKDVSHRLNQASL